MRGTFTLILSALTLAVVLLIFSREPKALGHVINDPSRNGTTS